VLHYQKGDLDQAKQQFEEALREKPGYGRAKTFLCFTHFKLGQQSEAQGNLERAIAEFEEAVRLEPDEAYWHAAMARLLAKQGNYSKAADECTQAARLSPEDMHLANGCGLAQSRKSESKETDVQPHAPKMASDAFSVRDGVSAPIALHHPEPKYSKKARSISFQGMTVLWIVVDAEGNIEQARVVQPLGLGLDQQALHAVRTWRFKPGMRDGKPVPVKVLVEVQFRLY